MTPYKDSADRRPSNVMLCHLSAGLKKKKEREHRLAGSKHPSVGEPYVPGVRGLGISLSVLSNMI